MKLYDGEKLKNARKSKGLTQEKVSEVLNIGRRQISQMENGIFDGGIKYLLKYLSLLNLELSITPGKSGWDNIDSTWPTNFEENDFNTLENREVFYSKLNQKNYILFHFDEKWIFSKYIKDYVNIEPSEHDLELFLTSLSLKLNKNIIVTTGNNTPNILTNLFKKNLNDKINLIENINFSELEFIISCSSLLISCHGAVSHVAAAKNIKQIDIIDKSYDYTRWTKHFRNYKSLNRKTFNELSAEILNFNFI